MKKIKYIIPATLLTCLTLVPGCKNFSEYQIDPNRPTLGQTPPTLILTNVISSSFTLRPLYQHTNAGWSQYMASYNSNQGDPGFQGYQGGAATFSMYEILRNVMGMEQEAERTENPAFLAVGKLFRAYCFIEMSIQMGDIPMSDALKGKSEKNYTPFYDLQKDVFANCLELLDQANTELAEAAAKGLSLGKGDIIYGGDPAKWQKAANALRLRILINLSRKADSEPTMKIKEQFAEIVNNPAKYPLFTSGSDDALWTWYDKDGNRNPLYYAIGNRPYYRIGNTYYNLIRKYNDPRIAAVAERTKKSMDADPDVTEFNVNNYGGVNCNDLYDEIDAQKDVASAYHPRYLSVLGEPSMVLGYAEQCFTIAEAIERGWLTGDIVSYYESGIRASMKFYGISDEVIADYLSQPSVVYAGGLDQILSQKYIAFFNNSGWESFYNIRRTGIPALQNGANNVNPSGKIPVRWRYPQGEYNTNLKNVTDAINRQYSGSDGVDDVMWLLK